MFGALETKDWRTMLERLLPFAKTIVITSFNHKRNLSAEKVADYVRATCNDLPIRVELDVDAAFDWCGEQDGNRLVAGSLYMVGAVLARFTHGLPVSVRYERENERMII